MRCNRRYLFLVEGIPSQGLPVIGTPLDLPFSQLINSELLFKKGYREFGEIRTRGDMIHVESENSVVVRGLSRETLICVRNYSNLVIMMILLKYLASSRAVICTVGIMVFLFPHIAL